MERRLHTRHRARTAVYVSVPGRPGKLCRARNLSANGVFIETENLGLKKGASVHLAFAINLGVVTKIHRRTAIVAHVSKGGTVALNCAWVHQQQIENWSMSARRASRLSRTSPVRK